jgi:hypothetical protein
MLRNVAVGSMPRKGSPYAGDYARLRRKILGGGKRCAYCSSPATETDHVPPLALHDHTGRGCCHLVPSCGPCARLQGGLIRVGRLAASSGEVEVDAVEPVGFDVLDPVWDRPWLSELRDVPESAVWPRLMTVPHPRAVGSFGDEFAGWCRRVYGVELRWWQRLVATRLLEHDVDGRLVWRTLVLTLARQLGKSTLLASILLWRMIHGKDRFGEEQLLLHVARVADAAREVQRAGRVWAKAEHLASSSRWLARAEDAVYGMSATTALADEAWDIDPSRIDEGVEPTLVAHEQPQLLLTSTAHRRATSLMPSRRAVALAELDAGEDGDLLIEWSSSRNVDPSDRTVWRLASPHWDAQRERDITRALSRALSGESLDPSEPDPMESFRAQWLNIWPLTTFRGKGEELVGVEMWRGLRDADLEPVGPLFVAVEDCFGRGASVAAASVLEGGRVYLGGLVFPSRDEAYAQARRWCDLFPGSMLLVGVLLRDDVALVDFPADVEPRGTTDTRAALSLLRELVAGGVVLHDGSDVEAQVSGARVVPAPSGGLQLINSDRFDLVRAAAWAVAEAHRSVGLVSVVHGGPLP